MLFYGMRGGSIVMQVRSDMGSAARFLNLIKTLFKHRQVVMLTSRVEVRKKYAGSFLGQLWTILYPALFLSIYLFLYLVVFSVKIPAFSTLTYVLYIFTGLVPYLFLMDSASASAVCVRQNIHLIKNVIMPIEVIPPRTVLIALVGEVVGLALVVIFAFVTGEASWKLIGLPLVIIVQLLFVFGLAWMLAAIGAMIPDLGQIIGLVMLLLMFLSPVAFTPDMVPAGLVALLDFNPVFYMLEAFRFCLIRTYSVANEDLLIFFLIACASLLLGGLVFSRFKNFIVDFE